MMTDGREAEVDDILAIPFARPRIRPEVMSDPRYLEIRNHLLTFLNGRSHIRPNRIAAGPCHRDRVQGKRASGLSWLRNLCCRLRQK